VRVEVLYFASLKERTGTAQETVEVDSACDVAGLWQRLVALHPALAEVVPRPAAACDLEYASWDRPLRGVREVAFLPPVSGG
jgi:molybdopterin synthase sulfur carrier subunit